MALIGIIAHNASAADPASVSVPLKANESFTSLVFHGDRLYVGEYQVINYKAMGQVMIYDRGLNLVKNFTINNPDPVNQYSMQPYAIFVNDDGSIAVNTIDWLLIYDQNGALKDKFFVRDYLGKAVNGKTYYTSTGLTGDGQYYYFGDSYGEQILKVGADGKLAGSYHGVNVTRSLVILGDRIYVADSGLKKVVVLDKDMNMLASYPISHYMDNMGTVDDYFLIGNGRYVYVYDRNMSLFQTLNAIPPDNQIWGISQSGGEVGFVTMNNKNRSAGLYVLDSTLFTTKTALPAKVPDPAPVVGAVVAGAGLGFLGIFLGKLQSFLNGVYESLLERLPKAFKKFNDAVVGYVKGLLKSKIFKQESRLYKVEAREHVPLILGFSSVELLVIAAGSVLLAASYVLAKGAALGLENVVIFLVSGVVAMVAHDVAHRYLARKYNAVAEYQFWWLGSAIMFVTAIFFGVVYAVPARTIINNSDKLDNKVKGIVYLAGPLVSFAFAMFFLALSFLGGTWTTVGLLGVSMNLLSSVYGLMPFNPMDGKKVVDWRGAVWAAAFIPVLIVYVLVTIYIA